MSSPKKRGEGTSCHHCKKRIRPNEMLKCTRGEIVPTNSRKRKRPCVKKYCLHCIKTFYSNQYLDDNSSGSFICPACRDECRCAACRRRVMKARLKNDGSALENEADGEANSILESQTPDATNIEEGQVNGLLEILDSRPDVQDIIRRGMAMDFADDNAKILYVGHLIDQALTRPDVLALYYASSHGRANNCRIKTESNHNNNTQNNQLHDDIESQSQSRHINNTELSQSQSSTANTTTSSNNGKRKRRNHNDYGSSLSPHRKNKHRKHHHLSNIDNNLPPPTPTITVKQEPISRTSLLHKNNVMLNVNGISAPQPATMSLSGGNPISFINGNNSFPPPINTANTNNSTTTTAVTATATVTTNAAHLSGNNNLNSINNQLGIPVNIPFPMSENDKQHTNSTNNNNNNIPPPPSLQPEHQSQSHPQSQNDNDLNQPTNTNGNNPNMFTMNIAPSAMMGAGPSLSAMSLSNM